MVRPGRKVALPKRLTFPLIVKSLFFEASTGISQASVVENHEQLARRATFIHEKLGTAAIVEQFIDGRELYVGVIGNERLDVLPPWEMSFAQMPDNRWKIATERVKWSTQYQKKHGIMTDRARLDAPTIERMQRMAKRAYRALDLSGYARIDVRMDEDGRIYVLEANPEPEHGLWRRLLRVGRGARHLLRAPARSAHRPRPALETRANRVDAEFFARARNDSPSLVTSGRFEA